MYTNLPVDVIVRLPHPWSGDSQGQEMFLAPSADKQTRNYDTEHSHHQHSISTLRSIYIRETCDMNVEPVCVVLMLKFTILFVQN